MSPESQKHLNTYNQKNPAHPDRRLDIELFEVQGAGFIAFGLNTKCRCGSAKGTLVDASWTPYGFSGGVIDKSEMVRLRDHLNALLG